MRRTYKLENLTVLKGENYKETEEKSNTLK